MAGGVRAQSKGDSDDEDTHGCGLVGGLLAVGWHEDQSKGSKVLALPMASLSTVASGLLTLLASRGKSQ